MLNVIFAQWVRDGIYIRVRGGVNVGVGVSFRGGVSAAVPAGGR